MATQTLDPEVENRVSTEAASSFIEKYYAALSSSALHKTLSTFYVPPTPNTPIDIVLNGQPITSPTALQELHISIIPSHYEVQAFDAHCLNPNYNVGAPNELLAWDATGKKMSVMVVVSGYMRAFDGPEKGKMRGFTETVVLVPNFGLKRGDRDGKKWVIQSQNFRTVF